MKKQQVSGTFPPAVVVTLVLAAASWVPSNGTLDVDWMAQTTGSGQGIGESRLRLPALHSGLVDSADDVPLLYQVYANLIFKPGFGEKAAAHSGMDGQKHARIH